MGGDQLVRSANGRACLLGLWKRQSTTVTCRSWPRRWPATCAGLFWWYFWQLGLLLRAASWGWARTTGPSSSRGSGWSNCKWNGENCRYLPWDWPWGRFQIIFLCSFYDVNSWMITWVWLPEEKMAHEEKVEIWSHVSRITGLIFSINPSLTHLF